MNAHFTARLLLRLVLASSSAQAVAEQTVIPDVPSRVETCARSVSACATLTTEAINRAPARKGYRWGGEDVEPPTILLSQLTVAVKGQDVFVPLSAFADLGNPRSVEVKATRRGFDVVILGGDASAAYRAHLTFEGRKLVRRRVQHAEFPKDAWEETRYKFNQMSN